MNQILRNSDFSRLHEFINLFREIKPLSNEFDPCPDALMKWGGILEIASKISVGATRIMDAGCGPSNLSLALMQAIPTITEAICIDRESISQLLTSNRSCRCYQGDFFQMCANHVADNSVDLIVDGCAVTHFDVKNSLAPNDGCYRFAKEASRILKPGGFYVTSSDFSLSGNTTGEFVCVDSMIESYEKGGLKLYSDYRDFEINDPFIANDQLNLGIVRLVFTK